MAPIPLVYTGMNISAWVRDNVDFLHSSNEAKTKLSSSMSLSGIWRIQSLGTVHACIDSREYCIHHSMGTEKKGAFLGKVLSSPIPLLLTYLVSQSDQLSNLLNNTTNCSWVRGQHHLRCQVSFTISSSMKSSFSFTSIQLCHLIPNSSVLFSIGSIKACILLRTLASTREGDFEVVQTVSSLLVEYAS